MRVSAVIPTTGRPELIRAVRSAESQTVPVTPIVVLDRPEKEERVRRLLRPFRHQLIVTQGGIGGSASRNLGIEESEGEVVAFLDDDDEWLPNKTELQLTALQSARERVVTCRSILVGRGQRSVPTQLYSHKEALASYLIRRDTLQLRNNFMQTSGVLMPRALAIEHRWPEYLLRHQDWGFFIDLYRAGATFVPVPQSLVCVYQRSSNSISRSNNWQASTDWLKHYGTEADETSKADFIASVALRSALRARAWKPARELFVKAVRGQAHTSALAVGLAGLIEK